MISNSKFVEILPSLQEACIKAGELQKKYHKTDIDIGSSPAREIWDFINLQKKS